MIKISIRGNNRKQGGYIFIDILVAILIAAIGFHSILSGLSMASKQSSRNRRAITQLIVQRNIDVSKFFLP